MIEQVEAGNVSTIIVKDHSRLGRNRLVVGYLMEEKFPDYGIRYIAINDGVDTAKGVDDSLAIRDLFNEWHARDTSKKIKAVIQAAAKRGERIGTKAPYEAEKQELSARAATLDNEISTQQDKLLNADRFLSIVDRYTDLRELTPEIVREFIDRIVVHERSEPWKKKNYTQEVEVYFNFVGKV